MIQQHQFVTKDLLKEIVYHSDLVKDLLLPEFISLYQNEQKVLTKQIPEQIGSNEKNHIEKKVKYPILPKNPLPEEIPFGKNNEWKQIIDWFKNIRSKFDEKQLLSPALLTLVGPIGIGKTFSILWMCKAFDCDYYYFYFNKVYKNASIGPILESSDKETKNNKKKVEQELRYLLQTKRDKPLCLHIDDIYENYVFLPLLLELSSKLLHSFVVLEINESEAFESLSKNYQRLQQLFSSYAINKNSFSTLYQILHGPSSYNKEKKEEGKKKISCISSWIHLKYVNSGEMEKYFTSLFKDKKIEDICVYSNDIRKTENQLRWSLLISGNENKNELNKNETLFYEIFKSNLTLVDMLIKIIQHKEKSIWKIIEWLLDTDAPINIPLHGFYYFYKQVLFHSLLIKGAKKKETRESTIVNAEIKQTWVLLSELNGLHKFWLNSHSESGDGDQTIERIGTNNNNTDKVPNDLLQFYGGKRTCFDNSLISELLYALKMGKHSFSSLYSSKVFISTVTKSAMKKRKIDEKENDVKVVKKQKISGPIAKRKKKEINEETVKLKEKEEKTEESVVKNPFIVVKPESFVKTKPVKPNNLQLFKKEKQLRDLYSSFTENESEMDMLCSQEHRYEFLSEYKEISLFSAMVISKEIIKKTNKKDTVFDFNQKLRLSGCLFTKELSNNKEKQKKNKSNNLSSSSSFPIFTPETSFYITKKEDLRTKDKKNE